MGGLVEGVGNMVGGLLGGNEPDTDGINDAARANAALSKEALEWAKQRYAEEAPARQAAIDMAMKTANQQFDIAKQNADISKDYYDYQKDTFRPLEQGIVKAAEEYDTAARREQKAGQAVAGVNTQIDNARTAMRERMAARGVDLGGGNMIAQEAAMAVQGGAAAAAAANKAREDVELQGYARKMDAANLGRGLASSQATSAGVALNAGNSSVGNAQVPVSIGNQATAGVQQGIQQAIGGNASAGSLYNAASGIESATRGQNMQFVSSLVNSASNANGSGLSAFMPSDENVKDGTGKKMSPAKALGAILDTPVHEDWTYSPEKGGPDDGRIPHDGPMAQDVQKNMGDEVAPGGRVIDPISMNGVLMAGIQGLAQEVKAIKGAVKQMGAGRMAAQGVL